MHVKKVRFVIFAVFTALLLLLLLFRYTQLMIFSNHPSSGDIYKRTEVERGPILDRNGRIIAIQTRLQSVTAWMPSIEDREKNAIELAPVLGMDKESILKKFNSRSNFIYIKRKITPTESKKIEKLILDGKITGITLQPEYGRNYPEKALAAHVTGFTGIDNIGLDGLELMYNDILSPRGDKDKTIVYGSQLFLTLDLSVQYFTEKLAREAYDKYKADAVMILVMDAKSGDFLGYTSIPEFDPNNFTTATKSEKENLPVTFAYEPGSVFKIFSLSSIMEIGGITQNSHFYCDGHYEKSFKDETIVINCLGVHGDVTPKTIIEYSCNAGAAYASDTVSILDFYLKLRDFGFGTRTNLPFPGETSGLLKEPENWSGRTKPTIAIGQEISVSAVQMITAATVLANEGVLLKPNIVKKIVSPEGKLIKNFQRTPVRNVISPATARAILQDMKAATLPHGTARRLKIEGLSISAKTGTAQKIDPKTGKYSEHSFIASTMAILPTENPKIIVYAVIDNPKGKEFYGGRIVAPLVKELVEKLIPILGIQKSTERTITHPGVVTVSIPPALKIGDTVPDLTGFAKKQLLPLFELKDINIKIVGDGWVESQEPLPGTKLKKGMTIKLILK